MQGSQGVITSLKLETMHIRLLFPFFICQLDGHMLPWWNCTRLYFGCSYRISFESWVANTNSVYLQAASMFKGAVPPVVPFALGSLGFMTPFRILCFSKVFGCLFWHGTNQVWGMHKMPSTKNRKLSHWLMTWKSDPQRTSDSERYKEHLDSILEGPINITLRHRLRCQVVRHSATNERKTEEPILVFNEVTIARGILSCLTNLECYFDDTYVTLVQGDGLILSTTSGSTAYSLAAGGSIVHPQVSQTFFFEYSIQLEDCSLLFIDACLPSLRGVDLGSWRLSEKWNEICF